MRSRWTSGDSSGNDGRIRTGIKGGTVLGQSGVAIGEFPLCRHQDRVGLGGRVRWPAQPCLWG